MAGIGHNGGPPLMAPLIPADQRTAKSTDGVYKQLRRLYSRDSAPAWVERKLWEMAVAEVARRDAADEMDGLPPGTPERGKMLKEVEYFRKQYEAMEKLVREQVSPRAEKKGKRELQAEEAEDLGDTKMSSAIARAQVAMGGDGDG